MRSELVFANTLGVPVLDVVDTLGVLTFARLFLPLPVFIFAAISLRTSSVTGAVRIHALRG